MDFPNPVSTELLSVKQVAEIFKVEERTVTKWIRENRIPAKKGSKHWYIREDHAFHFLNNKCKMPGDYLPIDNRGGSRDIFDDNVHPEFNLDRIRAIQTFSGMETGKTGYAQRRATKIPHEFLPRINNILNKFPQYQGVIDNLLRDALWSRILDLEQIMKDAGHDIDPAWAAYEKSTEVLERCLANDNQVKKMLLAVKELRKNKNKKAWLEYKNKVMQDVLDMEEPWRSRSLRILKSKVQEEGEAGDV